MSFPKSALFLNVLTSNEVNTQNNFTLPNDCSIKMDHNPNQLNGEHYILLVEITLAIMTGLVIDMTNNILALIIYVVFIIIMLSIVCCSTNTFWYHLTIISVSIVLFFFNTFRLIKYYELFHDK